MDMQSAISYLVNKGFAVSSSKDAGMYIVSHKKTRTYPLFRDGMSPREIVEFAEEIKEHKQNPGYGDEEDEESFYGDEYQEENPFIRTKFRPAMYASADRYANAIVSEARARNRAIREGDRVATSEHEQAIFSILDNARKNKRMTSADLASLEGINVQNPSLAFGVGVDIGGPLLAALALGGLWWWSRRSR